MGHNCIIPHFIFKQSCSNVYRLLCLFLFLFFVADILCGNKIIFSYNPYIINQKIKKLWCIFFIWDIILLLLHFILYIYFILYFFAYIKAYLLHLCKGQKKNNKCILHPKTNLTTPNKQLLEGGFLFY